MTLFQWFVVKLIECDALEGVGNKKKEQFLAIFQSFFQKVATYEVKNEGKIYLFLKRVSLADYFLLDDDFVVDQKNQSKFIDWDEIQSISNLSSQNFQRSF